jgi:hypothetical protein
MVSEPIEQGDIQLQVGRTLTPKPGQFHFGRRRGADYNRLLASSAAATPVEGGGEARP